MGSLFDGIGGFPLAAILRIRHWPSSSSSALLILTFL